MKTFEQKLKPHWRKFNYLRKQLVAANEIWNFALGEKRRLYAESKTSISKSDLQKFIKEPRNSGERKHWKLLDSQAVQQITDRIYAGYELFFLDIVKPKDQRLGVQPPKFKPLRKQKSFTLKQSGYTLDQERSRIRIGRHWFKYFNSRTIEGDIKTITVKKNRLGEFFIYITTDAAEIAEPPKSRLGKSIAFDFGLHTFLTAENEADDIASPLFFKQHETIIKRLNRSLSSKKNGSKNRHRARAALTRAHINIANRRKDFHWKTALKLVQGYEMIYLETLNVKAMQQLWGKKIGDLGFSNFISILRYLAAKYCCKLVFIDRWFPSSKTCSCCGKINKQLELREREWTCDGCGTHHHRDRNAAANIRVEGEKVLKQQIAASTKRRDTSLTGVSVRPSKWRKPPKAADDDSRIPRL